MVDPLVAGTRVTITAPFCALVVVNVGAAALVSGGVVVVPPPAEPVPPPHPHKSALAKNKAVNISVLIRTRTLRTVGHSFPVHHLILSVS